MIQKSRINAWHEEPGHFMTNRMRNLGHQPKDVIVLWIYMNGSEVDGVDIRNKVMSIDKTVFVEDKFMVAQRYVNNMLGILLEQCIQHGQSKLNIASMHVRQVENTSHVSQQYCNNDWVDNADERKLTSIGWFIF